MTVLCIARADPRGLDRLAVDAVALPFFEVRAQPLGVAGSTDWRLCGRLARMIRDGQFSGRLGEAVLMPTMGRFLAKRIFLLGLGELESATPQTVVGRLSNAASVLFDAKAQDLAVAPPTPAHVGDVNAAEAWIEAIKRSGHAFERVTLMDADGALEAGRAVLRERAKEAGFKLEQRQA